MRNVVLDLDSTLIHTCESSNRNELFEKLELYTKNYHLRRKVYSFDIYRKGKKILIWGVFRPHLHEFLDYCFENFDHVIVWSAGDQDYVERLCNAIFGKRKKDLYKILSRKYCSYKDDILIKDLKKLFEEDPQVVNETNTVIVDDNEDTFYYNRSNALHIKAFIIPYVYEDIISKIVNSEDKSLNNIMEWLDTTPLFWNEDVRNSVPEIIF